MSVPGRLRRHPHAIGSIALLTAVVGGGILALSGHWRSTAGAQGGVPVPARATVVAAAVRTRDVGVYLNGLGTVTPLNTVTLRTRVDGELIAVRFQEGQIVSSGELLAEIDPRPFEAQLTQFEGQLERDQALLDNARVDLKRFQVLVTTDAVPRQQLDTQASLVHQLEGTVKNDQGQIDATKVQLAYCRITSPIAVPPQMGPSLRSSGAPSPCSRPGGSAQRAGLGAPAT
jgi:multidrug efflux system membrane fusion protein